MAKVNFVKKARKPNAVITQEDINCHTSDKWQSEMDDAINGVINAAENIDWDTE
jgi:hypothetical protein